MAMSRKIVFVSGLSGAGKTTLGETLKRESGFRHFNVDIWAFGGDPIGQSGEVPNPAMFANRDPTVKEAFENMMGNGFGRLSKGEATEFSVWEAFFSRLCAALKVELLDHPADNFVVTFSVYLRSVRDYIRDQLSEFNIAFVVLNPSVDNVAARKVAHLRNTAEARGQTLSQFLRSFHPDSNAPEMEESAIVEILSQQARNGAVGFEPADAGEPRTLAVGDLPVEEIQTNVLSFLLAL